MGNLMRHDASQFRFRFSFQDQSGIHEEEAAGQRKSVDFLGIQHLDSEGHLGVGIPHQVLADAVDVFRNNRVVDYLGVALHRLGQLLAHGDFGIETVEINPAADIAVADGLRIVLLVGGLLCIVAEGPYRQETERGGNRHQHCGSSFHVRDSCHFHYTRICMHV